MSDNGHDDGQVSGHRFGDPDEAREYFTPERMADARPREMRLDENGNRLPETDSSDDVNDAADLGDTGGSKGVTDSGMPDDGPNA